MRRRRSCERCGHRFTTFERPSVVVVSALRLDGGEGNPMLGIAADLMMNPLFPEDKIAKKRADMLEEIRSSLAARRAYAEVSFPYFVEKQAPVSGERSMRARKGTACGEAE